MTLSDYLATLTDEEQTAFVDRVRAIGSRTVDVYSANVPKAYDEERSSLDVDQIHAVHHHQGPGNSSHYHMLLLDYQYAYWSDSERRPAQGWLVAANKANKKWFKPTEKRDGPTEDGPRHVYGSSAYDPETKTRIFPGKRKKQNVDEVGESEVTK